MRKKKAIINILFSLVLEIVTVIVGLIVPRLIIGTFGSTASGLVNSISSFVGYIVLLQSGVGSVVKAALYKPLAQKSHEELCVIVKTTELFFRKIALFTVLYLLVLSVVFPVFITHDSSFIYTASLVIIIGISTAAQYFFGVTYQMVLEADQRSYVYSAVQIASVIVNAVIVVVLINFGCSIQMVKLGSTVVFVLRPIIVGAYTKRKYKINSKVNPDISLIKQRGDGILQAVASFIHSKTDIFVLTVFSVLSDVSVYSVYAFVTSGLSSIISAIDKAVRAAFGNILANGEQNQLYRTFAAYNTLIHMFSTSCFATTSIVISNFIGIYVKDITDADYFQPVFSMVIITAEFVHCLRMPYNSIIYVAGKFKETKIPAIIEAGINIVISCAMVQKFGLVGIAVGTLVAMIYRTIAFINYLRKSVLMLKVSAQIRRYVVSFIAYFLSIYLLSRIDIYTEDYLSWMVYAGVIFVVVSLITFLVNLVLDYKNTGAAVKMLIRRKKQLK